MGERESDGRHDIRPRPQGPATPKVPYQVVQGGTGERLPVAVGIGIWALLFVIGLFIRPELNHDGRGWWIWTALAGVLLGFVGYAYLVVRRPGPRGEGERDDRLELPPIS